MMRDERLAGAADFTGSTQISDFALRSPQELSPDAAGARDSSRLLVLSASLARSPTAIFRDILDYLRPATC